MKNEKHKEVALRFMREFLEEHNIESLDDLLGPSYTQHNPLIKDGKEGLIGFFQEYWKQYHPTYDIQRVIAENDLVAIHYHYRRNEGDDGLAIVDIFRLENGKLVEHWDVCQPIPKNSQNEHPMF